MWNDEINFRSSLLSLFRSAWMPVKSSSYVCRREKPPPLEPDRLSLRCVSAPMENSSYHKQELAPLARSAATYASRYSQTHFYTHTTLHSYIQRTRSSWRFQHWQEPKRISSRFVKILCKTMFEPETFKVITREPFDTSWQSPIRSIPRFYSLVSSFSVRINIFFCWGKYSGCFILRKPHKCDSFLLFLRSKLFVTSHFVLLLESYIDSPPSGTPLMTVITWTQTVLALGWNLCTHSVQKGEQRLCLNTMHSWQEAHPTDFYLDKNTCI